MDPQIVLPVLIVRSLGLLDNTSHQNKKKNTESKVKKNDKKAEYGRSHCKSRSHKIHIVSELCHIHSKSEPSRTVWDYTPWNRNKLKRMSALRNMNWTWRLHRGCSETRLGCLLWNMTQWENRDWRGKGLIHCSLTLFSKSQLRPFILNSSVIHNKIYLVPLSCLLHSWIIFLISSQCLSPTRTMWVGRGGRVVK